MRGKPLVHHGQSQRRVLQVAVYGDVPCRVNPFHLDGYAQLFDVFQLFAHREAAVRRREHGAILPAGLWREGEGPASALLRLGGGHQRVGAHQLQAAVACLAVLHRSLECHAAGQSLHHVSPLGIERELELRFVGVGLEITAQRTQCHVSCEHAFFLGFVVDGEHAAIEFLVVAEEVACHGLVVEVAFGVAAVWVFGLSPVQLPSGVGPQLEESRVEGVGQCEESAAPSVAHLHQLALHEESVVVPQFGIQHAADSARASAVGAPCVGREPEGVAQEVASVVHVHVHLLLRHALPEQSCPLGQCRQR